MATRSQISRLAERIEAWSGTSNIIGVVAATVDVLSFAGRANTLPQNVNFAIEASVAIDFLETHNITVDAASRAQQLAPEAVADRAASLSVHIACN